MIWNVCFRNALFSCQTALIACFTPCVFNFEWCNASNWYLTIHYLYASLIRGFQCSSRGFCSEVKVNGCFEIQCPCSVFRAIWFLELVYNSSSFSYTSRYSPPLWYPATNECTHCLFSAFLDSLFFPSHCYDPLMPFLLFKAVVFFIGNWSKCSLSANVLSCVIFT